MLYDERERVTFLEKQNEELLKALVKKAETNNDSLLKMVIEQQKLILKLSQQIGIIAERDKYRERQIAFLMKSRS